MSTQIGLGFNRHIYSVPKYGVLRDNQMHDQVTFNNQSDLNLIIDERIKYDREYILLDRVKVEDAITDSDNLLNIFSIYEMEIFFKQAAEFYYITDDGYAILMNNPALVYDTILMNDIHEILFRQLSYRTRVPSISDLENNGLLESIIRVIQNNSYLLVEKNLVNVYTNEILAEKLEEAVYTSFEKIEYILEKPSDIRRILTSDEILILLERIKSHLSFVNDTKIQLIQDDITNNIFEINHIFTSNEIKAIIDKEVELKNLLLKYLTINDVEKMFEEFKNEFFDVELTDVIEQMVSDKLELIMQTDYTTIIQAQVEEYLTNNYNRLISDTISNSFNSFKTELLTINLPEIVTNQFNILRDELLNQDNSNLVRIQVQNYLDVNFPRVTEFQVQTWIDEEINK